MQLDLDTLREAVEPVFRENFETHGELGAAVSIWQHGRPLLDLQGGFRDARREQPWTADTIVLFWSATKGLGAACLLHALQEHGVALERRVTEFWPAFGQGGKAGVTIAQMMSHQAGLCALDERVDVLDDVAVVRALERQPPLWTPGTAHGYHARTFGYLLDELTRRVSGTTIGNYWREVFAEPMQLDVWIGLPESEHARVATMYAAKSGKVPQPEQFYRDLATPGTLVRETFTSPAGLHSVGGMNAANIRSLALVSFGGIGSASSLAKFYAMLANRGELDGRRFFDEATIKLMSTVRRAGTDRVFQIPTAFSAGFMKDPPETSRKVFGPSALAFGHPGAGGSHAFADPENGIAFAYVMNQMEQSLLPNEKSLRLVDAIYR